MNRWDLIVLISLTILLLGIFLGVSRASDFPEMEMSLTSTNSVTTVGFKDETDWTFWNKFWFTGAVIGNTLDTTSTIDALDRGCIEKNPLLGEQPNEFTLVTFKVAVMGLSWILVEQFSKPEHVQTNRNLVYGFQTIVMNAVAIKNYNLECY